MCVSNGFEKKNHLSEQAPSCSGAMPLTMARTVWQHQFGSTWYFSGKTGIYLSIPMTTVDSYESEIEDGGPEAFWQQLSVEKDTKWQRYQNPVVDTSLPSSLLLALPSSSRQPWATAYSQTLQLAEPPKQRCQDHFKGRPSGKVGAGLSKVTGPGHSAVAMGNIRRNIF